jgi:hypothetical protein
MNIEPKVLRWGTCKGFTVYLVNADWIRKNWDEEFDGGSPDTYEFIPEGEIWVDADTEPEDIKAMAKVWGPAAWLASAEARALIARASEFAKLKHSSPSSRSKQRKYTGEPYHVHLKEVADLVEKAGLDHETVAAAWLHDTLEDTPTTKDELRQHFGDRVANLVDEVTDRSQMMFTQRPDGRWVDKEGKTVNRPTRKAIDREHLKNASPEGKSIKLADLVSNTHSIVARDPGFARTYLQEKAALLPHLREGHPELYAMAERNVPSLDKDATFSAPASPTSGLAGYDLEGSRPRKKRKKRRRLRKWLTERQALKS